MQDSNIPVKFPIPFANNAGGSYVRQVPTASQTAITPGAASLFDGFPPLNFIAEASGGVPPFGQDMNGILLQITQWLQWVQAGAPLGWDSAFSTAIGGYPKGAVIQAAVGGANWWLCTAENNTSDPDLGGSNWLAIAPGISQAQGDARYARPNQINEWSKPQWGDSVALAVVAGHVAVDLSLSNSFKLTGIAADFIMDNPTNIPNGVQSGQIEYYQNGTGNHVITSWGNKYVGINGNKPNLTAGANGYDIFFLTTLTNGKILVTGANSLS